MHAVLDPTDPPLLKPHEPPPYVLHNEGATTPILVVADHASNRVPENLNQLGLAQEDLDRHVGWDIGSDQVALELSRRLDATLVMASYSRLVVDLNRSIEDPTFMPEISDDVQIPGNQGLSAERRQARIHALYTPYRCAVDHQLRRLRDGDRVPALIAVHSFTPAMKGFQRPWQFGVLWDKDPRIPIPLMANLRAHPDGLEVGDNEPYSGKHPADYTIDHHAEAAGLPHVSIEIRQDLISDVEGARTWAGILHDALAPILADPALYQLWQR